MSEFQQTIKEPVSIDGVGLHTGRQVTMTFKPGEEGQGYRFKRVDLEGDPEIQADVNKVIDVSRGTTLEQDDVTVHTVEHTLAALAGLEIDNVIIELNSPEPPVMDGSAQPFVDKLLEAGLQEQKAKRNVFQLTENIRYEDSERDVEMVALPDKKYRVSVMVDYNSDVLGAQHASVDHISEFQDQIASSRTFCFLHELEELLENNLIKGGDLNNAIVVVDRVVEKNELAHLAEVFDQPDMEVKEEGILNNVDLHYQNEPARHKLLDVVGDLALIGRPLNAQIIAKRPGHKANVEFARKLKKHVKKREKVPAYNPQKESVCDINRIKELLPHRYPFLLVDKVIELTDEKVVGVKNVTVNEHFFQGHFPDNPVMPGVLQIEAMAQTGGVLVLNTVANPKNYNTYFLKIDKARFKDRVLPGDSLILELKLMSPIRRGLVQMEGTGYVGDKVVSQAELLAQISEKE